MPFYKDTHWDEVREGFVWQPGAEIPDWAKPYCKEFVSNDVSDPPVLIVTYSGQATAPHEYVVKPGWGLVKGKGPHNPNGEPDVFDAGHFAERFTPVDTPDASNLQPGLYRHYKGGRYMVLAVARLSVAGPSRPDEGDQLAVYVDEDGHWHVRPVKEFSDWVDYHGGGPGFRSPSDYVAMRFQKDDGGRSR